jgi:hypothetical protein
VFHLSSGEVIVELVLGVVFGGLGFWLSERDRRRFGRTPWGLPSLLWAVFWFISWLIALVLFLIAHSGVVRRARQFPDGQLPGAAPYDAPYGAGPLGMRPAARSSGSSAPSAPSVADQFPSYPRPANGTVAGPVVGPSVESGDGAANVPAGEPVWPSGAGSLDQPTGEGPSPSMPPHPAAETSAAAGTAPSPPAWHADPGGRFHYRWWDGTQWTSYVSFNGQQLIDTSPDQRIGPY